MENKTKQKGTIKGLHLEILNTGMRALQWNVCMDKKEDGHEMGKKKVSNGSI